MQLEIRHLKLIKAIVDEGSISNAINVLYLTPSALSHQLREAEQQVGARIFNRVNKKMVLTEVGRKILDAANSILDEMDAIQKSVKLLIKGESGLIRICMECCTNYYWLPAVLKKFSVDFPGITIKANFETTDVLINKLLSGEMDLVVTSDPIVNDKIEYVELFEDEMLALVSSDHEWGNKAYVDAQDFKNQKLIIFTEPLERVTVYQKVLQQKAVRPADITVLPNTETAAAMVKENMGIMVAAQWAIKPYLLNNQFKTLKVTAEGLFSKQYIASLKHNKPEYYDYFINFLKEEIVL